MGDGAPADKWLEIEMKRCCTRREFLCAAGAGGVVLLSGCEPVPVRQVRPRKIGKVTDFIEGLNPLVVDRLIITRRGSEITAMSLVCTHQECLLNLSPGSGLRCPCHGSEFSANGDVLNGPATMSLPRYRTWIEGEDVWVDRGTIL